MRQYYYILVGLALWGANLSCSSEGDIMEETPVVETLDVPISFNLLSSGDGLTTRVSPDENDGVPNAPLRDNKVDLVKVYVYQRKEGGSYVNKTDGFMKSSEYTLNAIKQAEWPHYIAEGIIQLQSGYEYRITAVAYGEKEFNEKPFEMVGESLSRARIDLDEKKDYQAPELFFGTVVYNEQDTIFRYSEIKNSKADLSGWLYRGVAGIELTLRNVPDTVQTITLLADSVYTQVNACYYDDFKSAFQMERDTEHKRFKIGSWNREGQEIDVNKWTLEGEGPNLLTDICTSLTVRIRYNYTEAYARLRVREVEAPSADRTISTKSLPPEEEGGNGIGIIPGSDEPENPYPEDPEESRNPYTICFLRNNYYQIEGDYDDLMTNKYVLKVTVNPYWDADVSLSLDKVEEDGTQNP